MLLPFFQWCEAMWLGNAIRTSLWLFPVIEAVHLLGLCLLGGTVLIVDLRMLGFGLKGHTIAQLAREQQRRARRRVDLRLLVALDNLGIIEIRRRQLGQVSHQDGADGEVGRDEAAQTTGPALRFPLRHESFRLTCRAHDQRNAPR